MAQSCQKKFDKVELEKQVAIYGVYLKTHIHSQEAARQSIASHGGDAGRLMAEVLSGKRSGFDALEAIRIINSVQEDVCSLRETSVPDALREFLKRKSISNAELTWATGTLEEIETSSKLPLCK